MSRDPTGILDTGEAGGRAIRGGVLRTGGYLAGALVALVSVPLLVRHLGLAEFGRYVTVLSLIAIVAGVAEAGLGNVAVREYAALPDARRRAFMRDVLGARLVLTAAGVVLAVGFAVLAGYDADMVLGTALAGVGIVLAVVQATYVVPLFAGLRAGWVAVADIVRAALTAALVVLLVVLDATLVWFVAITIPITLVLLGGSMLLVRGDVPFVPAFHPARWWGVIRETLPLAAATAVGTLYFRLTVVVMSLIATATQTGYFTVSYRLLEALAGIPLLLVGVAFPILARAARDDAARLRYATQRLFEIALIGGVWMTLATFLGASFAMDVIGGDDAAPAADVLRVQALYLVALFLNLTCQTAMVALRMHRELLISAVVALATILVLAFALIPPLGARGAAIAVVAGESVLVAVEALLLLRARPDLRPSLRVVPRVAVALAVAGAAGLALELHDVVRVAVATVLYVGVLAALRAIPSELLPALLGRPPRPGAGPGGL